MDSSLDNFKRAPYHSKKHSSYFAAYDLLLKPYRNKPITFLEIGVLNGGSLFMWKSFLGEHARIVGIDLNPAATKWEEYGFEIYIGSQSDSSFWLEILAGIGPIDVIVDDGGHTFRQQILTCEAVLPSVRNGGVIIIEDTHSSYMTDFGGPSSKSFVSYAKNIVDGVNYRSGKLQKNHHHKEIFYVSFFESIVAFHIDRTQSHEKSQPVENQGKNSSELDFRHSESKLGWAVEGATRRYIRLRMLPAIGPILALIWKRLRSSILWILSRKDAIGLRRYFRF